MSPNCEKVRRTLASTEEARIPEQLRGHLEECSPCARFAERVNNARGLLGEPARQVEPDAGFAARVAGALPARSGALGWAALRLLPATFALALVLTGWTLWATQAPANLVVESPSEDLLTWVLDGEGSLK